MLDRILFSGILCSYLSFYEFRFDAKNFGNYFGLKLSFVWFLVENFPFKNDGTFFSFFAAAISGLGEFFYFSFEDDIKKFFSFDFWIYFTESQCIVKHFGLAISSNCNIFFGYWRESTGKEFLSTRGCKLGALRVDLSDSILFTLFYMYSLFVWN